MANATYYIKTNTSAGGPTGRLKLQDKASGGSDVTVHENDGTDVITFDRSDTNCTKVKGWYVDVTGSSFGTLTAFTFDASHKATVSTAAVKDHYVIFFCDEGDSNAMKAPSNVSFTLKKKNTTGDD